MIGLSNQFAHYPGARPALVWVDGRRKLKGRGASLPSTSGSTLGKRAGPPSGRGYLPFWARAPRHSSSLHCQRISAGQPLHAESTGGVGGLGRRHLVKNARTRALRLLARCRVSEDACAFNSALSRRIDSHPEPSGNVPGITAHSGPHRVVAPPMREGRPGPRLPPGVGANQAGGAFSLIPDSHGASAPWRGAGTSRGSSPRSAGSALE